MLYLLWILILFFLWAVDLGRVPFELSPLPWIPVFFRSGTNQSIWVSMNVFFAVAGFLEILARLFWLRLNSSQIVPDEWQNTEGRLFLQGRLNSSLGCGPRFSWRQSSANSIGSLLRVGCAAFISLVLFIAAAPYRLESSLGSQTLENRSHKDGFLVSLRDGQRLGPLRKGIHFSLGDDRVYYEINNIRKDEELGLVAQITSLRGAITSPASSRTIFLERPEFEKTKHPDWPLAVVYPGFIEKTMTRISSMVFFVLILMIGLAFVWAFWKYPLGRIDLRVESSGFWGLEVNEGIDSSVVQSLFSRDGK